MIQLSSTFHTKEFSCAVPDVDFSVSFDRAKVTVELSKSGSTVTAYEEYLYPDGSGRIVLSDMDRLLQPYADRWLVFDMLVSIVEEEVGVDSGGNELVTAHGTQSVSVLVVCCRAAVQGMTADAFCDSHFLTLMEGVRQTAPGWLEYLCFIGSGSASCRAEYEDGTVRTMGVPSSSGGDYTMLDCSPSNFASGGSPLVGYTVTCGNRSQQYEVVCDFDPDIAPVLLFFNSFGVQELAYCTGEHQQVSSFSREQARIGRLKTTYDITETEKFKADTGVLTYPMANWWRDVLRSKDIRVLRVSGGTVQAGDGVPVVITSEKAELSNAPDHLPRYTFEYEYADRNHNMWSSREEGRIFDNTFDNTFN